jgi:His-Xaa-Ser repeat protein HxsA
MKHLVTFSSLLGALCLAAPVTGWSKDKHHHGGHRHHSSSHHGSHNYHGSHRYHHGPSISFRSYRSYPSYGYGYGYSPYSYYPYSGYSSYYSGPSVGLSYATGPTYYSTPRVADYDDDLAVDVQRALARRGLYRGAIDGDVGPGTRAAIREYQYQNRLEVTGRIDRSLLRALGIG